MTCRVCGCTDHRACLDDYGHACHWVEPDLCSVCAELEAAWAEEADARLPRVELHTEGDLNAVLGRGEA